MPTVLEHAGEQAAVGDHLDALPAGEGHHHGLRAGGNRHRIAGAVDVAQLRLALQVIALIDAARAAVAEVVLRGGYHVAGIEKLARAGPALQTQHHGARVLAHERRILRVALVAASPALVADDRQGRSEGPVEADRAHFLRGRLADQAHQRRVVRRAEADVLREYRRAIDVVVAVNGVYAPELRDGMRAMRGRHGRQIELVGESEPGRGRRESVAAGLGVAAVEDRAERVAAQVGRCQGRDVTLDELSDLLLERHAGEQRAHLALESRIGGQPRVCLWPDLRVNRRGRLRGVRRGARQYPEENRSQGRKQRHARDDPDPKVLVLGCSHRRAAESHGLTALSTKPDSDPRKT